MRGECINNKYVSSSKIDGRFITKSFAISVATVLLGRECSDILSVKGEWRPPCWKETVATSTLGRYSSVVTPSMGREWGDVLTGKRVWRHPLWERIAALSSLGRVCGHTLGWKGVLLCFCWEESVETHLLKRECGWTPPVKGV